MVAEKAKSNLHYGKQIFVLVGVRFRHTHILPICCYVLSTYQGLENDVKLHMENTSCNTYNTE